MSSSCHWARKLGSTVPSGINMHPGYMSWVEFRSHARPAICFKLQTTINPCIITATTRTEAVSTKPCSNANVTTQHHRSVVKVTQYT